MSSPEQTPQHEALTNTPPPDGIRAFDAEGREVIIPREDWRTQVLPQMIQDARDQPDQLYVLVLNSMNEGFFAEVADAAEHLYQTDTVPARGACMWAIVLTQTGRLDEAETVLNGYTAAHGEDGSVLTNLAKVYAARGEQERAESTLWHALEVEPNLENGLAWFAGMAQERSGDQGAFAALERVRALSGSWRAQLWMARGVLGPDPLEQGRVDAARALYHEALSRVPRPVPADFLMQMSGDLGGRGLLTDLLAFTAPNYVPELHGMAVGNNLIKALLDTGQVDAAEGIRSRLESFNRPDWRQPLTFWAGEIARLRQGAPSPDAQPVQIGMLRVDGPIWLPGQSPAARLFGTKVAGGPSVTFLGGTAEAPEQPGGPQDGGQVELLGRLTRALPLFLAEQVELLAAATGRAMLPWAVGTGASAASGFVVSGQRWPDEVAVQSVGADQNRSDYVVAVHLDAETEPWTADLVFLRTTDGVRIGELEREFDAADPVSIAEGVQALAREVIELLGAASREGAEVAYTVPAGAAFASYLTRAEQLLAVRCAAMPGVAPTFLTGERGMLDGALQLAQAAPESLPAHLLLVETFAALRTLRPETAAAFQPELEQFESQHPLPILTKASA